MDGKRPALYRDCGAGNPIGGLIATDGKRATVTFTDSSWEYLSNGDSYSYIKQSNQPYLWN